MTTRQHFENAYDDDEGRDAPPPPKRTVLPSDKAYGPPPRVSAAVQPQIVYADQTISIYDIHADVTQPRRALPAIVRQVWDGKAQNVEQMFAHWLEMLATERGYEDEDRIDKARAILDAAVAGREREKGRGDESVATPERVGVIERALLKVADLASSIRESGLLHKIAVIKSEGSSYLIEAGERRWLAFHLLYLIYREEKWLQIPATIEEKYDAWKQAFENNARDDLNAVSRARQLAKLIMTMFPESRFKKYHQCNSDREYYAQVSDGITWRVPRGTGDLLLQGTGLKNMVQLAQYRALLKLPDEIWVIADDLDWTENKLRPLASLSTDNPAEALRRACAFAREEGYTLTTVNVCDQFEAENADKKPKPSMLDKVEKAYGALERIDKKDVKTMNSRQREELRNRLATMKRRIEELENWVDR